MKIIHSIIIHDAIGRPKIVLDQLREGLCTLGFATMMSEFPELFEPLFVHTDQDLTGGDVINILAFPLSMDETESTSQEYLIRLLHQADKETIANFLIFKTGAPCLPDFGLGKIEVKFDDVQSMFASTCFQSLTLPRSFPDESTFITMFKAVVNTMSKSFNCV